MKSVPIAIVHDYLIQMGGRRTCRRRDGRGLSERTDPHQCHGPEPAPARTRRTPNQKQLDGFVNTSKNISPGPFAFRSLGPVEAEVTWIGSSGFAKWFPLSRNTTSI
jgi:hypothetical protein